MMSGPVSSSMREKGLAYKLNFGVDAVRLRQLADQLPHTHELAAALCEKLGGDSLDEQRARFAALPTADSVRLNPAPKIFWPEP